ncbi:MAG: sulfurtransferase TusA family protein [Candidatus Omnitrophica bacterium]|nr:sulfurtransferase TusA family protein [Candidatus Omnitrophota bacterium]
MPFDKEINLRGTVCPYNFVKSKLALEEIDIGQILRVIIDFPSAAEDVPRGMEYEGQEVLCVNSISKREWEILIRRKK